MGIHLHPQISTNLYPFQSKSMIGRQNPPSNLEYSVKIANQVYKYYQAEDFRFCDHGTTPKTIAE